MNNYFNKYKTTWRNNLTNELNNNLNKTPTNFPLIENTYGSEEIMAMVEVLVSDRLTMGKNVDLFEKEFAQFVGAKYAIMVNSGSSANLLAMAVGSNFMNNKLKRGDKVAVPTVCWSTSIWPIVQMGLVPVFIDADPHTMNMDIDDLESKLDDTVKGIVAVHIMGGSTDMDRLMKIVSDRNLFLMEDTCEALGSQYKGKTLGTFGDMGTYSFYYSHHITTVEGGMVVCNDDSTFEILKCLRAHGWTRFLKNKSEYEAKHTDVDPRYLFVNVGYNLRPMETQAAMGRVQLKKLNEKNFNRVDNCNKIMNKILTNPKNNGFLEVPVGVPNLEPAWFGLCFILGEKYKDHYSNYLKYLSDNNVENRPLVTGNFARQPVFSQLGLNLSPDDYPGAEILHFRGFYTGLSCAPMSEERITQLVDIFLSYDR